MVMAVCTSLSIAVIAVRPIQCISGSKALVTVPKYCMQGCKPCSVTPASICGHYRSSNGTNVTTSTGVKSSLVSVQSAAHIKSATTYMVVFQDAVSVMKIQQLCSSAEANYGFTCDQMFTKTFKGFVATVSASLLVCLYCLLSPVLSPNASSRQKLAAL